ncbi:MAG TPA: helix-turn-helix domain-containing protein [Candidatus Thermoplasmatota archaeon]|nr:helix-turn-helix domain-containing protein [Candidatus Thermoplasmatota archaeon]
MSKVPPKAAVRAAQQAIQALDHPLRQRILVLLHRDRAKLAYGEISKGLGLPDNSLIAHHLKVLVGAALVGNQLERIGGRIHSLYFISDSGAAWLSKAGLDAPDRVRVLLRT